MEWLIDHLDEFQAAVAAGAIRFRFARHARAAVRKPCPDASVIEQSAAAMLYTREAASRFRADANE
ncbi:hypothetical protein [Bradyrhizobium sp. 170]|uniref:hypothetical protein n=1 Tax=Bradyrhizobium sp. 170 TaxID=2782641 RepID=UPI001FFF7112|nr:hypothetical protein [Bradyrhizobium sp. 170]UPK05566.1 hypothetical protein IVB05_07880 [Bradyrhizobium sp. 170]